MFPNTTMEAEWDCLAQILHTLHDLADVAPTIDHVKGHQDESMPYEELPLLAQLNCDADSHANRFLWENPTIDHTKIHQFPKGMCLLQLSQGDSTRNIKQACAEARTLPAYKDYLCRKSKWWHSNVFDMVDWISHGQALKQHSKHHSTLVKYIHRILPTGKQIHRYNPKYPPGCPSCQAPLEDIDHFWKCQAHPRLEWRRNFIKNLKTKLLDLGTGPQVRTL